MSVLDKNSMRKHAIHVSLCMLPVRFILFLLTNYDSYACVHMTSKSVCLLGLGRYTVMGGDFTHQKLLPHLGIWIYFTERGHSSDY